ncbi:MAG TPA: VWA domain-containing protein [Thermoanaerobaculia bacterium]
MNARSAAVLCWSLLLLPCAAYAQQAGTFGEVLEVGLTSVDVVATDAQGNPVTGLKASDFEVYEDGKRQAITNFSAFDGSGSSAVILRDGETPQEVQEPPAPRKFIFYIDDSSLTLENRRAIFPSVRKFLSTYVREGDQALLVTWNRALKVRVPWTTDRAAIDGALVSLEGELSSASVLLAERQRAERLMSKLAQESKEGGNLAPSWAEVVGVARGYAESRRIDVMQSTNALTRLLASLTGVDGKKVLVMATDDLPTLVGADLFQHLDNIRASSALSTGSSFQAGARSSSIITDTSQYDVSITIDTLARAANATGVTIYGINPKGLGGPAEGKAGLQMPTEANLDFARNDQSLAGIKMLANRTGGVAMVGAPADMALERVGRDLSAYYSLGYRSTPGKSPERKIEVRATRPGVRVRSRSNVYYRSLEREMADRVIANHLQSRVANPLGVSLEADPVAADGSRRLLPVRVVIPMNMLTLLPDGKGGMTGGFSVFTCSSDGQGGTSGVNVQSQAIHFTAEQAAQMQGRRIGFAIQVPLEKGRDRISVGVLDHVSQEQGFVTMKATL